MGFNGIIILSVFVCFVASEDLIFGKDTKGKKIYDEEQKASPTIWIQDQNVTVTAQPGEVIGKILITDLRADKKGEAKVVEGGIGHENVTIELKSPTVLRGYEFHVQVFSVPESEAKLLDPPRTNLDSLAKSGNSDNFQVPAAVAEVNKKQTNNQGSSTAIPSSTKNVKIYEVTSPKHELHTDFTTAPTGSTEAKPKTDIKRAAIDITTETLKHDPSSTLKPITPTIAETSITIEDRLAANDKHAPLPPLVPAPQDKEENAHSKVGSHNTEPQIRPIHPLFNRHPTQVPVKISTEAPISRNTHKIEEKRNSDTTKVVENKNVPLDPKLTPLYSETDKIEISTEKSNEENHESNNKNAHVSTHKPTGISSIRD